MSLNQYLSEIENAIAAENDTHRRGALVAYKRHVELALDEQTTQVTELAI